MKEHSDATAQSDGSIETQKRRTVRPTSGFT